MINIEGLNRAAVLAALYNAARPQGLGFLTHDPEPMTVAEAERILGSGGTRFDYVNGRVLKVDLGSEVDFDPSLYDRDNGNGAAASAIELLRITGAVDSADGQREQRLRTARSADETRAAMDIAPGALDDAIRRAESTNRDE